VEPTVTGEKEQENQPTVFVLPLIFFGDGQPDTGCQMEKDLIGGANIISVARVGCPTMRYDLF
jgi:hypothetical protein